MSGGKLKIEVYPAGEIFPSNQGLDSVGMGVTELASTSGSYFVGKFGTVGDMMSGMPGYDIGPIEWYNFWYEAGFLSMTRDIWAEYDVFYIAPQISSPWHLFSKNPIHKIEDFEGMKIRAHGLEGQWFEKMGAKAVLIPGSELYTALATGVVDAARWGSPAGTIGMGLHEVGKHVVYPAMRTSPNNSIVANMDAWESLPDDLKHILDITSRWAGMGYYVPISIWEDAEALQEMISQGAEKNTIPAEDWAKMEALAIEAWDEYFSDDSGKQGLTLLKDYLAKME
jgi:TRAP-type mannitol/chloroaromatic compound transport system substrate-binding protein